jgi:hypothetical protein
MTEAEWLACTDPQAMVAELAKTRLLVSDRKLRLWVCAGVREFSTPESVLASHVPEVEELADRSATPEEYLGVDHLLIGDGLAWARQQAANGHGDSARKADLLRAIIGNPWRPYTLAPEYRTPLVERLASAAYEERVDLRCQKCIGTGSKYPGASYHHYERPSKADDCEACGGSGRSAFAVLDPDRLAILADALEEAGVPESSKCEGGFMECGKCYRFMKYGAWWEDKIEHKDCHGTGRVPNPLLAALREPVARYRGFWALDAVLGRE